MHKRVLAVAVMFLDCLREVSFSAIYVGLKEPIKCSDRQKI